MNFKATKKVLDSKKSVLDSEILRVRRAMRRISDSSSPDLLKLQTQYKALVRKKVRDSLKRISDTDLSEIKSMMLADLKNNLDQGKIYYASGADVPGESVLYATKDTLLKAVQRYGSSLREEFEGVETEEDLKDAFDRLGLDTEYEGKYFKIASDWNDTSEVDIYNGNKVEDLYPAIDFYAQLFLEEDPDAGQVRFIDDNDEMGEREFETV